MSLQQIYDRYDAENDLCSNVCGERVWVTWAEYDLAVQVEKLLERVQKLENELKDTRTLASGESLE
jgi:hypothetical protein